MSTVAPLNIRSRDSPSASGPTDSNANETRQAPIDSRVTARPNPPTRKDTDVILSYYQSEDAGVGYTPPPDVLMYAEPASIDTRVPRRRMSTKSTTSSPSEYSPDSEEAVPKFFPTAAASTATPKEGPSSTVRRRPSIPSEGGSDRRRLAIMDMGTIPQGSGQSGAPTKRKDSIRSRRGLDDSMEGLALVAPPDASRGTYTELTPPSSAPATSEKTAAHGDQSSSGYQQHLRSASEVTTGNKTLHRRKSSRNIGIIGTSPSSASTALEPKEQSDALNPPIFQVPQSRSPSPGSRGRAPVSNTTAHGRADHLTAMNILSTHPEVITPGIGEGKEIQTPVAAPVIVSLLSASPPQTARPTTRPSRSPSPTKLQSGQASPDTASLPSSGVTSAYPSPPTTADPYLFYQPGVHATAGPLPPPPRATFNIAPGSTPPPRPPRINSPPPRDRRRGDGTIIQALQVPESTGSSLSSKKSNSSFSDLRSESPKSGISDNSEGIIPIAPPRSSSLAASSQMAAHTREGAFPPSIESSASSPIEIKHTKEPAGDLISVVSTTAESVSSNHEHGFAPPTVIEPSRSSEDSDARSAWLNITQEDIPRVVTPSSDEGASMSVEGHGSRNLFRRSTSRSPPKPTRELGDDGSPSSSPRQLGRSLTANLKRFSSLPRTPSRSARSDKRLSSGSASTASTLPPHAEEEIPLMPRSPPPIQKIISPWPQAMFYADVKSKKSALERSLGYAAKINELYVYDCGLSDYVADIQARGGYPRPSKQATLAPGGPRGPSTAPNSFQPRHISRSSMASEATFPRRADTTTATDLLTYRSQADTESVPQGPPPLPYPSLVQPSPLIPTRMAASTSNSSASSARTMASPTSMKSPTGFFSSLGRKASMKGQRGALSPPPLNRLQKSPAKAIPSPRPVNISSPPSLPGGPRAVPNRASRSQTIILPPAPAPPPGNNRASSINRRPSLFSARRQSPEAGGDEVSEVNEDDPEFASQVARLSDLLPQVDKTVLAGYLRRAGSDLNAIGQYLEDEKNGTIQYN